MRATQWIAYSRGVSSQPSTLHLVSLFDALITEPYGGLDVFFALRTDGLLGSGRADDPYSGANLDNPRLRILTITKSGTTATVKTATDHGFVTNQRVQIGGVLGIEAASASDVDRAAYYNGIFTITRMNSDTFTYVMAGDPGGEGRGSAWCKLDSGLQITSITYSAGTGLATATTASAHGFKANDLVRVAGVTGISGGGTSKYYVYNGTFAVTPDPVVTTQFTFAPGEDPGGSATSSPGLITCLLDPYLFDRGMRSLPANTPARIFLGPGVFETRGYTERRKSVCWRLRSNMKLVGSGMSQTTVRLVDASYDGEVYTCVAGEGDSDATFLDSVEVSDLTCDADIARQTSSALTCAAVLVRGRYTRVRRVRAINFGTQNLGHECFVISVASAYVTIPRVTDCTVENCVVEQPGLNNSRETTCVIALAGQANFKGQGYHSAARVRESLVDCEFRENPQRVSSISLTGTVVTVKTPEDHGLIQGQWIRVSGVRIPTVAPATNQYDNLFNGSFKVAMVLSSTEFTYDNPSGGIPPSGAIPSGDIFLGRWPSQRIALNPNPGGNGITGLAQLSTTPNIWSISVNTLTAHYLSAGARVFLNQVPSFGGVTMDGVWKVTQVGNFKQFTCQREFGAGVVPTMPGSLNLYSTFMVPNFQAVSVGGGTLGLMEGNTIANCTVGGPYQDTFATKDLIVRRNYYRGVLVSLFHNMGGYTGMAGLPQPPRAVSLTNVGAVATLTLADSHGLAPGQPVNISGVTVGGSADNEWNSFDGAVQYNYVVAGVPSSPISSLDGMPTSLTYVMSAVPLGPAPVVTSSQVATLWQIGRCVFEDNVVEILPGINDGAQSCGIYFYGPQALSPPFNFAANQLYPRVIIRKNHVRYVGTVPEEKQGGSTDLAMFLLYCQAALVESNVVDLRFSEAASVVDPLVHRSCGVVAYSGNCTPQGVLIQGAFYPSAGNRTKQQELTTRIEETLVFTIA